jgi:hypothetical protein
MTVLSGDKWRPSRSVKLSTAIPQSLFPARSCGRSPAGACKDIAIEATDDPHDERGVSIEPSECVLGVTKHHRQPPNTYQPQLPGKFDCRVVAARTASV